MVCLVTNVRYRHEVQVEGVGTGAHAAAAKHGKFELDKLANWKAGDPVPFAFLADTFETIAEESKRLVITNLLVGNCALLLLASLSCQRALCCMCSFGPCGDKQHEEEVANPCRFCHWPPACQQHIVCVSRLYVGRGQFQDKPHPGPHQAPNCKTCDVEPEWTQKLKTYSVQVIITP